MKKNNITWWMRSKKRIFKDLRKNTLDYNNKKKRRVFIGRNSKILFVAHLDTVLPPMMVKCSTQGKKGRLYAQGLDDRLGCLVAYTLSQELGCDLLLTDLEETGATTAEYHNCVDYNWVVEFDRAGSDVVTYDKDNKEFLKVLKDYWEVGFGSFSDISKLQTKACCMNIGIGYERAHSKDSYVDYDTLYSQIEKFREFYNKYKDTKFIADDKPKHFPGRYNYRGYFVNKKHGGVANQNYDDLDDRGLQGDDFADLQGDVDDCEICGHGRGEDVFGHSICPECFEEMFWAYMYGDKVNIADDK